MRRYQMSSTALACALGLALGTAAPAGSAWAQIGLSVSLNVGFAPPELPVYDQPPIPDDGYIWTPGYWAWDDEVADYYWVPGTWVQPPSEGLLWTPGYWGYDNGQYGFIPGYWGPEIGFYGGVDYGFGYNGDGYEGGYWQGNHFFYNTTVNNVTNVHITNVYNKTVVNVSGASHASFNGGPGGVAARPTPQQLTAARQPHVAPTANQVQHAKMAASQPDLRASVNHGKPAIAATSRATSFTGPGVVPATRAAAPYVRPATAPRSGAPAARPSEPPRTAPPPARTSPPSATGGEARARPGVDSDRPAEERAPPEAARHPSPAVTPPAERPSQSKPVPLERTAPAPRPETSPLREAPPRTGARTVQKPPPAAKSAPPERKPDDDRPH